MSFRGSDRLELVAVTEGAAKRSRLELVNICGEKLKTPNGFNHWCQQTRQNHYTALQ